MPLNLKEQLMNKIKELPSLNEESMMTTKGNKDFTVEELIDSVKSDVKKGNRATFKLIQELEMKLQEYIEKVNLNSKQEIMEETLIHLNKKVSSLQLLSIELFDQIDRIYQFCQKIDHPILQKELEKVRIEAIHLLDQHHIKKIEVEGKLIDGKTMISLGKVPKDDQDKDLESHQVISVVQQGFLNKETKEIIRKAKVITVE